MKVLAVLATVGFLATTVWARVPRLATESHSMQAHVVVNHWLFLFHTAITHMSHRRVLCAFRKLTVKVQRLMQTTAVIMGKALNLLYPTQRAIIGNCLSYNAFISFYQPERGERANGWS